MQLYVKGFLAAIQGVPVTLGVTLASIIIGVLLGLVLALMKMSKSKALSVISGVYVEVVRGTPLVVQALILAYGLPQLLQSKGVSFKWPYLVIPAIIVCGLNSAAYVAEVWGMRNAYPAQKLMQGVRRYSAAWCRWAVESAAEADLAMKSSGRDPEELLVDLVLLLANGRGR